MFVKQFCKSGEYWYPESLFSYCKKSTAIIPPGSATTEDHFSNKYEATHKLLVIPQGCTAWLPHNTVTDVILRI